MYKIIGNDGKTYGPVPAEQIREWISQGRVENRTSILPDGALEWTFIGLLPEFARHFSISPPVIAPLKTSAGTTNGFAVAGFICGLLSLFGCCCCGGIPFNLLGLIFSLIAMWQINSQSQKQAGWGLALAGLICSVISLLAVCGLTVLQLALPPSGVAWHFGAI